METENIPVDDLKTEAEVKEVIEDKKPEEVKVVKKRHGKEEKLKKKEDKNVEQILRNLGNSANTEEKLIALCRKYSEISDENRKLSINSKQNDKKLLQILKENEQVQSEKSKLILQKSRLESLCRELQKQNKSLKEESLLKVREEEEKRKEVSDKFQSTLSEINVLMTEANGKNEKLFQDNIKMEGKFKTLLDEMHLREQRFEDMRQMMNKELEIAKATLAKVSLEMTEEKETLLKDKNVLLIKLSEYQNRIKELQSVETNLRSQVSLYTDKYNEFQTALSKSNEIFNGFNKEMEKMTKKIVKLEKETSHWKSRWEKSHSALLEMASDKQIRDAENLMLNKKCSKLQELCKTFQQERAKLIAQLKEYETGVPAIEGNKTDEINNGTLNQNGSAVTANSEMSPKPICPKFDLNSKTTRPKFDSKPCCPKSTCTKSEITHKFTCPKSELNSMCTKMKNNSKLISKESSKNKIIKTAAQCEKNLLESKIDKCNSQETNNINNIKLEEPILKEDSSLINNVNIVESMNQLKCSDNDTVGQQIKTTVPENNVAPLLSDNPPITNTES